jgi:hypothetical protein
MTYPASLATAELAPIKPMTGVMRALGVTTATRRIGAPISRLVSDDLSLSVPFLLGLDTRLDGLDAPV